jgi:hypothetical protein
MFAFIRFAEHGGICCPLAFRVSERLSTPGIVNLVMSGRLPVNPAELKPSPILLRKVNLSQDSTHGLDPTGLKWRRPEIARIIQDKSFVRGMETP